METHAGLAVPRDTLHVLDLAPQCGRQRGVQWPGAVALRVHVERCLVVPELEHDQRIREYRKFKATFPVASSSGPPSGCPPRQWRSKTRWAPTSTRTLPGGATVTAAAADNIGLGFWTHQLQGVVTRRMTPSATLLNMYPRRVVLRLPLPLQPGKNCSLTCVPLPSAHAIVVVIAVCHGVCLLHGDRCVEVQKRYRGAKEGSGTRLYKG